METTAQKTWMPTTAGILNIIAGALSALLAIGLLIALLVFSNLSVMIMNLLTPEEAPFIMPMLMPMLIALLVLLIIEAVFPIIGGVCALQRRRWGWALAGSIIAIFSISRMFPPGILGIASTVFVAISKDEFES